MVERYDRRLTTSGLVRVHQEDMCQAMGIVPMRKYENEGGPGAVAIIDLLRTHSGRPEEDVATFVDSLMLNWLIAGTDAHAKNYSLLIGAGGRVRLAPLYDMASALPYDDMDIHKLKLALRIGKDYRLRDIGLREWLELAARARLDAEALQVRLARLAEQASDEALAVKSELSGHGLNHNVVARLADGIAGRARTCLAHVRRAAG